MQKTGKLYLIPTTLGESNPYNVLPDLVIKIIEQTNHYIVENEKTARRFIKKIDPKKVQAELSISVLNKHTPQEDYNTFLSPCNQGKDIGIISEAGCPGIADPGAEIVRIAHQLGLQVVPLVGPSSLLLAMMASGMNGQNFAFNGYLPIDKKERKSKIKELERKSNEQQQSQLFIETPYRNDQLIADLLQVLQPQKQLCIACDITLDSEQIQTKTVQQWKKQKFSIHKRPAIFIL